MATICVSWPGIIEERLKDDDETILTNRDILLSTVILTGGTFDGSNGYEDGSKPHRRLSFDFGEMKPTDRGRFKLINKTDSVIEVTPYEPLLQHNRWDSIQIVPGIGVEVLRVVWTNPDGEPQAYWVIRGSYKAISNM